MYFTLKVRGEGGGGRSPAAFVGEARTRSFGEEIFRLQQDEAPPVFAALGFDLHHDVAAVGWEVSVSGRGLDLEAGTGHSAWPLHRACEHLVMDHKPAVAIHPAVDQHPEFVEVRVFLLV